MNALRPALLLVAMLSLFAEIATAAGPAVLVSDAARPLYSERDLTDDDLAGRTLTELTLMRNWIYARAGNPFRKAWLRDYFLAQPWYEARESADRSLLSEIERRNASRIARAEVAISREELMERRRVLAMSGAPAPAEALELELIAERLGEWRPADAEGRPTPLQDPTRLDRLLTLDDLADLSRRDLRLLRNLVYARRDRPFRSEFLRLYFGRFEWYNADSVYTDARLTPIDRRNVTLIRSLEDEIGGPLNDAEGAGGFGGA